MIILGRTGTGKSVLTDTILTYLSKKAYIVLIDTKNEYYHIPVLDFKVFFTQEKGIVRINELTVKKKGITTTTDDLFKITEFISANIFSHNQKQKERKERLRRVIVCVEELGNICKKGGRLYDVMPFTAKLLQQGRSLELGFIGISQRPQEVHTTFLSQADHIFSFEVSSKHDLEAMKSYFNPDSYNDLKRFEFFHYNVKDATIKQCYPLYENELYHSLDYYRSLFGRS